MSQPMVAPTRSRPPLRRRPATLLATAPARFIVTLKPHRIRRVLSLARRGATPATTRQALAAREAVITVSARCAGEGCLQRSVPTALLRRTHRTWPT
ncbi:lasso peptide biosynthesis B2 protein [Streptomyces sp. NPDC093982]|uniref:lasso peptide biosynthesis B2 protein n=1 Tax=Streptomyces sp. NPDC093982 TaxID=3155077 RepID=UPI003446A64F